MIRVVDYKKLDLTNDEWLLYQKICKSYDTPTFKGADLFKNLFETDEHGIIIFLKPPSTSYTSMEVWMFLVAVMVHQHLGAACKEADRTLKEGKLALAQAQQPIEEFLVEGRDVIKKCNNLSQSIDTKNNNLDKLQSKIDLSLKEIKSHFLKYQEETRNDLNKSKEELNKIQELKPSIEEKFNKLEQYFQEQFIKLTESNAEVLETGGPWQVKMEKFLETGERTIKNNQQMYLLLKEETEKLKKASKESENYLSEIKELIKKNKNLLIGGKRLNKETKKA